MKTMMKSLESIEQFEQLWKQEKPSVLVFSANWCPDCTFIKPFLPKLIDKYSNLDFYYVDRDQHIALAQRLMVMGIPSFVAVGHDKELARFVSRFRKTEAEIDSFLAGIQCD